MRRATILFPLLLASCVLTAPALAANGFSVRDGEWRPTLRWCAASLERWVLKFATTITPSGITPFGAGDLFLDHTSFGPYLVAELEIPIGSGKVRIVSVGPVVRFVDHDNDPETPPEPTLSFCGNATHPSAAP